MMLKGGFGGLGGLRVAKTIRHDDAGAVAEDDEGALFVNVIGEGRGDAVKRLGEGWLPFWGPAGCWWPCGQWPG